MFFAFLTLFVALSISGVAAYYSIVGLMAIFSSAKISIAIMGGVLEIGKLIVASWTFRNWKTSPLIIKSYFVFAAFILMMITSLGIFGFLSRAHLQQTNPTTLIEQNITGIQTNIDQKTEQKERFLSSIEKLDAAFEKYVELGAVTKGMQSLEDTKAQRLVLEDKISVLETQIQKLNVEKLQLQNEIKMTEIEIGPIRYVANLIYDDVDKSKLEDAVRIIIILLVLVFDPLAIMLIIAGNISLLKEKKISAQRTEDDHSNEITVEDSETDDLTDNNVEDDDSINKKSNKITISKSELAQINFEDTDKTNSWKINDWKEKGFKTPNAYMSFLKKFGNS